MDSQDVAHRDDKGANPLFDTNQSQLSAPDDSGYGDVPAAGAGAVGASVPASFVSTQSRKESSQEFPKANPLFSGGNVLTDSDDDEMVDATGAMANPMYQSAHSGITGSQQDIMGTASSMGGDYGEAEAPGGAQPSASGQPFANPLSGQAAEEEEEAGAGAGANPLFAAEQPYVPRPQQQTRQPATNYGVKPAGQRRV